MSLVKLLKTQFIPFLDTSKTVNTTWVPTWKRIDLSTIFSLAMNPQTVTQDYISTEVPVEVIDKNQPELPQEIALYQGNPIFDFVYALFKSRPVGSAATVPLLMCFGGTTPDAWQVKDATLVLGELNTVDGKITFTMKLGGNIADGTFAIAEGVPTFTPAT